MAKGNTVHLKMNRSFRTGRKLQGIADKAKRFDFKAIKDFNDLRSFFYEYSLFVGDISSLPGAPKMRIVSNMRHRFLKAGRLMGDAKAIGNTVKNLADGVQMSDFEGAGERYWRRFGGRMTGKALMSIPGSNIFARGARSVLGANMQKAFDAKTKVEWENASGIEGLQMPTAAERYDDLKMVYDLEKNDLDWVTPRPKEINLSGKFRDPNKLSLIHI